MNVTRLITNQYKSKANRPKYSLLHCKSIRKLLNSSSIEWEKSLRKIISSIKNIDK